MASLNKIILIGRLTKDPEEKTGGNSGLEISKFSIAVDRRSSGQNTERQTDFFDCTAFRGSAGFMNKFGKKGRLVAVEGRVEIDSFVGKDGTNKKAFNIVCDDVKLLDKNPDAATEGGNDPL